MFCAHASGAAGVAHCRACGLVLRNPQPSDAALRAIYGPGYCFGAGDRAMEAATSSLKSATAELYLDAIAAYRGAGRRGGGGLRLLDIGYGHGDLLARARARGYEVHGIDVSADAVRRVELRLGPGVATQGEPAGLAAGRPFDVCVLSDVIEHSRHPRAMLLAVARILRRHWMEFKEEHLFYFAPRTIRGLLDRAGYEDVLIGPSSKRLNLDYVAAHLRRFHVPVIHPAMSACQRLLAAFVRRRPFSIRTGGIVVMARRGRVGS